MFITSYYRTVGRNQDHPTKSAPKNTKSERLKLKVFQKLQDSGVQETIFSSTTQKFDSKKPSAAAIAMPQIARPAGMQT